MLQEEMTKLCGKRWLAETTRNGVSGRNTVVLTQFWFWFWFGLFSEPLLSSAQTQLDNCTIQQTPAWWGALKPLTEPWEHLPRDLAVALRMGKQGERP